MNDKCNLSGGITATDLLSSHVIQVKRELHVKMLFSDLYYLLSFIIYLLYTAKCVTSFIGMDFSIFKLCFSILKFSSNFLVFFKDVKFELVNDIRYREGFLRKAKNVFKDFIEKGTVHYLGNHGPIIPNISGVRYPIDFFIKHFYDRFYPAECLEAFDTYRRVNPDLDLRLDHLAEFSVKKKFSATKNELKVTLNMLKCEFLNHDEFGDLKRRIQSNVKFREFHELRVDLSSAAGYPHKPGVKRSDCYDEAVVLAINMLDDDDVFDDFMSNHCWYTTGRAKMISQTKVKDKGRLIMYAGFSPMLIAMLVVQPVANFMNLYLDWCAVGSSWMHGGANDFAKFFKADKGFAPDGFRYVSVDIKSWDAHLRSILLFELKKFYEWLLNETDLPGSDVKKFLDVFDDMVEANVLFPGGHLFKLFQGMKSGWASTANDNTLIHRLVFRGIENRLNFNLLYKLYGDDNFMLLPDEITNEQIVDEYARFGCTVGTIHSSRYLGDVDFLCKYVHYRNGDYFIFRPPVETHARLLMPEELNPGMRECMDSKVAAERCLGHLLDNPFCKSVRIVCLDLLKRLKDDYGITEIFIDDKIRKKGPWKRIDIVGPVPTVPTDRFIAELYGVNPVPLRRPWPSQICLNKLTWDKQDASTIRFDTAYGYSRDILNRVSKLSRQRFKKLLSMSSPYAVPKSVYGTHAARLEFAVRYFKIHFDSALDFGSHPGACAASLLKRSLDVTCVSLKPDVDYRQPFCPYVFKDKAVKLIDMNANDFVAERNYDLLHDDVDVLGDRNRYVDIRLAVDALTRGIKLSKKVNAFVMTIHDYNPEIFELIFKCYLAYGSFNIVKPHFSHPWRCEFMLCFKRYKNIPMRKRTFLGSMNHFLNSHAASMISWSDCLADSYEDLLTEYGYKVCPLQNDNDWNDDLSNQFLF